MPPALFQWGFLRASRQAAGLTPAPVLPEFQTPVEAKFWVAREFGHVAADNLGQAFQRRAANGVAIVQHPEQKATKETKFRFLCCLLFKTYLWVTGEPLFGWSRASTHRTPLKPSPRSQLQKGQNESPTPRGDPARKDFKD